MKNLKEVLKEIKNNPLDPYSWDNRNKSFTPKRYNKAGDEFIKPRKTGKLVKYKPGDEKKWKEDSDRKQKESDEKRIVELIKLYGVGLDQYKKILGTMAKRNRLIAMYEKDPKKYNKMAGR